MAQQEVQDVAIRVVQCFIKFANLDKLSTVLHLEELGYKHR